MPNPTELEAEVVLLRERCSTLLMVLIDLVDVQNGPPLLQWAGAWQEAMDNALTAISDARADDA